jgi:Tfp pilus assembly protein FimT
VADPPVMEHLFKKRNLILSSNFSIAEIRLRSLAPPILFSQKGFTLVEVLIIFTLIGLISAIAVPNVFTMMKSYRLKSALNELTATIQQARMTAISQNANCVLSFNTGNQSYSVFSDNGNGGGILNDGVQNGTEPTIKTVNIVSSYKGDVTLNAPSFGSTTVFNSQGMCTPSGSVSLQNSLGVIGQVVLSPAGSIKLVYP